MCDAQSETLVQCWDLCLLLLEVFFKSARVVRLMFRTSPRLYRNFRGILHSFNHALAFHDHWNEVITFSCAQIDA